MHVFLGASVAGCVAASTGGAPIVRGVESADVILEGTLPQTYFGWSLAAADLDGDGRADLAVGQPGHLRAGHAQSSTHPGGVVRVFSGARLTAGAVLLDAFADAHPAGEASGDRYGFSLAAAGDLDGDGREDLLVGAIQAGHVGGLFGYVPEATGSGYVDVLHGAGFGPDVGPYGLAGAARGAASYTVRERMRGSPRGEDDLRLFGYAVAVTPSQDRDGVPEVVVGAPFYRRAVRGFQPNPMLPPPPDPAETRGWSHTGAVFVFDGASLAPRPGTPLAPLVDQRGQAEFNQAYVGMSVAGGDFDGDGVGDVWAGAPGYWERQPTLSAPCAPGVSVAPVDRLGRTLVWSGRRGQLLATFHGERDGAAPGLPGRPRSGWALETYDLDLDGRSDTILTAMSMQVPGGSEEGRVYVHLAP